MATAESGSGGQFHAYYLPLICAFLPSGFRAVLSSILLTKLAAESQ